jgi:hypothetical protein
MPRGVNVRGNGAAAIAASKSLQIGHRVRPDLEAPILDNGRQYHFRTVDNMAIFPGYS